MILKVYSDGFILKFTGKIATNPLTHLNPLGKMCYKNKGLVRPGLKFKEKKERNINVKLSCKMGLKLKISVFCFLAFSIRVKLFKLKFGENPWRLCSQEIAF